MSAEGSAVRPSRAKSRACATGCVPAVCACKQAGLGRCLARPATSNGRARRILARACEARRRERSVPPLRARCPEATGPYWKCRLLSLHRRRRLRLLGDGHTLHLRRILVVRSRRSLRTSNAAEGQEQAQHDQHACARQRRASDGVPFSPPFPFPRSASCEMPRLTARKPRADRSLEAVRS